ncbi:MAG TPA: hypothetical protein VG167_10850 [Verrucomicrobiae bacterium]|nr:hypothetical protein [Verrucomicrobiae bacterium]
MRTKALLGLAALAAGALTTMAQSNVYSLNIVGYVNVPLATGFNLVANPLDNGTNHLSGLFPNAQGGDVVFSYSGGVFTESDFSFGSWSTDLTLTPGMGFFYSTSGPSTNTFVGNVLTGNLTNHIPAGFSLVASQVPQSDTLGNLGFPATGGDVVFYLRSGAYVESDYSFGAWSPDLSPAVGESFWVSTGAAKDWVRTFNP